MLNESIITFWPRSHANGQHNGNKAQICCSMSSFARATRSSSKGVASNGSTLVPKEGAIVTPAVKKLLSEQGWNIKASGTKKQDIHYSPPRKPNPIAAEDNSTVHSCSSCDDNIEEDFYRYFGETQALRDIFKESSICRQCKKGELVLDFNSVGLATIVSTRCSNCSTHCSTSLQGATTPITSHSRLSDYAVNTLFVLCMMLSGDGGTEAGKLVGLLDLPSSASMDRSTYPTIEDDLAMAIIKLTEVLLQKNLDKEVELWAGGNNSFDKSKWDVARQKGKPLAFEDMPTLTASYDMGWQKRSSGRRYDSHSGHAALVGKLT